jgi:SAM-dependent methyltransferase
MDWVKEFYSKQNEWFGVYLGKVDESHHKRAWLVQDMASIRGKANVLELGAGGGQTAAAIANLGHNVTMIELLPESVSCAEKIAAEVQQGSLKVILGDFYVTDFEPIFDVICYFDSFGIGTDSDQRMLLKRVASWLKTDGVAIIEVGATWYWARSAGIEMDLGGGMRCYGFDPVGCRLIDKWWLPENPEESYSQSLRCYTPADLEMLLEGTGLKVDEIKPGGKVDFEIMEFIEKAELNEAMTYLVRLSKCST